MCVHTFMAISGKLGSYETGAILDRVRRAISEGVMEIWLTSEDTGGWSG